MYICVCIIITTTTTITISTTITTITITTGATDDGNVYVCVPPFRTRQTRLVPVCVRAFVCVCVFTRVTSYLVLVIGNR